MTRDVCVAVPAYEAGRTLEGVFDRIPPAARARIREYAVLNDGSGDDTAEVLRRLQAREPDLTVLTHAANQGYGATERDLLAHALAGPAAIVVLLHADGQYSPECIPELLAPIDAGEADLVQGSRLRGGGALAGGMPRYKYVANRALTAIENLAFGMRLAEYHSGYMVYTRRFLEQVPFRRLSHSFDFDLEMLVLARVKGLRIREVPIPTIYAGEVSHLKPVTYGLRVLRVVARQLTGYYRRLCREG